MNRIQDQYLLNLKFCMPQLQFGYSPSPTLCFFWPEKGRSLKVVLGFCNLSMTSEWSGKIFLQTFAASFFAHVEQPGQACADIGSKDAHQCELGSTWTGIPILMSRNQNLLTYLYLEPEAHLKIPVPVIRTGTIRISTGTQVILQM